MRFLLTTALKDLRRRLADPAALAIWIGLPLLLGTLIGLVFDRGGDVPTARVLVVNEDDSALTGLILGALAQGVSAGQVAIDFEATERAAGEKRIDDGDVTALLVVPAGFGTALLEEQPTTLTLLTNPAETILPAIVVDGLGVVREGAFYAQRVFGEPLRGIAGGRGPGQEFIDSAAVAIFAAAINERVIAVSRLFDPPLLEIDLGVAAEAGGTAGEGDGGLDLISFLLPGMLLMSILFIAQGMSDDVWIEKEKGTLRRAVWAPQPLLVFVAGKLLASLAVMAFVATIAVTAAALHFDLELARVPAAVLWCAFAGAGLFGLFLLISLLATSHRTANLVSMMVLFPMMIIGGSFVPLEALPEWMRTVGAWTPNGVALTQLAELLTGTPEPRALAAAATIIFAYGGLSLWLCMLRARRFASV